MRPSAPTPVLLALAAALYPKVDDQSKAIEAKVIAWRRDIHEHPELGNQKMSYGLLLIALGCLALVRMAERQPAA